MAPYVDFEAIRAQVTFVMVFERYGIEVVGHTRDEVSIRCPFHEDSRPSLKANLGKGVFNCFGACGAKGDVIAFVQRKEGIDTGNRNRDRVQAARMIAAWFGLGGDTTEKHVQAAEQNTEVAPAPEDMPEVETPADNPVLTFALKLDPTHEYLAERGLRPETIERFGLGYCSRGILKGRIAIPIHNERGELVAYAGRWPGDKGWPEDEGKYKLPPNFHKKLELYNRHRVPGESTSVVLVEGFWSVWWLWQELGLQNVVALMGCVLSEHQCRALSRFPAVKIFFDGDKAGREAAGKVAADLARQGWVTIVECPEGLQPDQMNGVDLRKLLG
jgi:DNA primase